MVLALVAFVIGSAIGIITSIEEHENLTNNDTVHVENVTVEMTTGPHDNDEVIYDYDADSLDFNDNYTRELYNLTD